MNAPITNLPAKTEKRSVLLDMATRFGMEATAFEATVRATCLPPDKDGRQATREEFAAFLLVAKEYDLNPLLKEIYGFKAKSGAIVPIVPIDGWTNIINANPALDGIEFDDHRDGDKITAITARIWRKDRSKPIVVTEYMAECVRATEPWTKWPRRMLRHKALIQCARYAFGFSGLVDPDEAERMGADVSPMRDVSPRDAGPPAPPQITARPAVPMEPVNAAEPVTIEAPPAEVGDFGIPPLLDRARNGVGAKAKDALDDTSKLKAFLETTDLKLQAINDIEILQDYWNDKIAPRVDGLFPPDAEEAMAIFQKHERRLGAD